MNVIGEPHRNIVRLMGGLGNQLFQYGFGVWLEKQKQKKTLYDNRFGFVGDDYGRLYCLDSIIKNINLADIKDIPVVAKNRQIFRIVRKFRIFSKTIFCENKSYKYDYEGIKNSSAYYFSGYWQNLNYLESIRDNITEAVKIQQPSHDYQKAVQRFRERPFTAIHVRRQHGVYASGKKEKKSVNQYGACGMEYYENALKIIGRNSGPCLVFGDDVRWFKENAKECDKFIYVEDNYKLKDYEEMLLMAKAEHYIIPNSTFSWWAAWLGQKKSSIVIRPQSWMFGIEEKALDLLPKSWHCI